MRSATPPAVARVLERVTNTARRHDMFAPGDTVVVAVSGGPDSLAMLHSLVRLRRLLRVREVVALHVDHGLRPGSGREAAAVGRRCSRLGVRFVARTARAGPPSGASPEAWARTERYAAIAEVRDELAARVAAVGHTTDDQAETVLLALLRGGGAEALAGMRPVTPGTGIVRPLLRVTRAETEAFCRSLRLRPIRDPMNDDPALLRAAIRHHVMPALEAATGRGVRGALVRTAGLLRDDADLLTALSDEAFATAVATGGGASSLLLDASVLGALPRALASRVLRRALRSAGLVAEEAHVAAALGLLDGRPGRRVSLPGRVVLRREREYLRVSFPAGDEAEGAAWRPTRTRSTRS